MKGRPDECPACGFVWGQYQGERHGDGYVKLAAYVWECTQCGETVTEDSPLHKHVARR